MAPAAATAAAAMSVATTATPTHVSKKFARSMKRFTAGHAYDTGDLRGKGYFFYHASMSPEMVEKIIYSDKLYEAEEDCLAELIDQRIDDGWGITKHELIALACRIGRKRNPEFGVGRVWYEAFMKRFKRFRLKRARRSVLSILLEGDVEELQNWKEETKFNMPKKRKNAKGSDDDAKKPQKKKKRAPTEFLFQRDSPKRKTKSQLALGRLKVKDSDDQYAAHQKLMESGELMEIRKKAWKLFDYHDQKIKDEICRRLGEPLPLEGNFDDKYDLDVESDVYTSYGEEDDDDDDEEEVVVPQRMPTGDIDIKIRDDGLCTTISMFETN